MRDNAELATILRNRNLKATSKRVEVLSLVSNYDGAIPFSEIQNTLQNIDRVTLYRTVHALIDNGIIHKALIDKNETFYAMCSSHCNSEGHQHKHIHFKCTSCLSVSCVQVQNEILLSIPNHSIEDFTIEATGICAACRN